MLPDYAFLRRLAALPFVDAIWLFGSRVGERHGPRASHTYQRATALAVLSRLPGYLVAMRRAEAAIAQAAVAP